MTRRRKNRGRRPKQLKRQRRLLRKQRKKPSQLSQPRRLNQKPQKLVRLPKLPRTHLLLQPRKKQQPQPRKKQQPQPRKPLPKWKVIRKKIVNKKLRKNPTPKRLTYLKRSNLIHNIKKTPQNLLTHLMPKAIAKLRMLRKSVTIRSQNSSIQITLLLRTRMILRKLLLNKKRLRTPPRLKRKNQLRMINQKKLKRRKLRRNQAPAPLQMTMIKRKKTIRARRKN